MKDMDEGKKGTQSLAIAYNLKKRMAQRKAHGGMIKKEVNRPENDNQMYAEGGSVSDSESDLRRKQIASAFGSRKFANGGMVENEDLDPMDEPEHGPKDMLSMLMSHGGMAKAIMEKKMMANGGMVKEDQNEDFLSDEEQDPYAHHNDFDEFEEKPKKRSILDSIMRGR